MANSKSFLDMDGLTYLFSYFQDYPDNEILGTVIDAIDNAKADATVVSDLNTRVAIVLATLANLINGDSATYGGNS